MKKVKSSQSDIEYHIKNLTDAGEIFKQKKETIMNQE